MDSYWSYSADVAGNNYKDLIQYLLNHSDAFQVVLSNNRAASKHPAGIKSFLNSLRGDRIGGWSKTGDYTLPLTEGTTAPGKYCTTAIFQISDRTYPVLCRPSSLFGWSAPDFPEDLSFYRNNVCWFSLCTSEELLWFCAEKKEAKEIEIISGIQFQQDSSCTTQDLHSEKYKLNNM